MNSEYTFKLVREMQGKAEGSAALINTLRRDLAEARAEAQEAVVRGAEMEGPLLALNKFTDYLLERTRKEREASKEGGLWTPATGHGALTLCADLCQQLDAIRRGYGL